MDRVTTSVEMPNASDKLAGIFFIKNNSMHLEYHTLGREGTGVVGLTRNTISVCASLLNCHLESKKSVL